MFNRRVFFKMAPGVVVPAAGLGLAQQANPTALKGLAVAPAVRVLKPNLSTKLQRLAAHQPDSSPIPPLPAEHIRVYTGTELGGMYNHHTALAKFKGRYYCAWSNGRIHEDQPGQVTLVAVSADGRTWSPAEDAVPAPAADRIAVWTPGLYATADRLFLYTIRFQLVPNPTWKGMYDRHKDFSRVDVHSSADGKTWQAHEGVMGKSIYFFEAPRLTRKGLLLNGGAVGEFVGGSPVAFMWDAARPEGRPQILTVPDPSRPMRLSFGETTWYETRDGRIVMWFRNQGPDRRLYMAVSENDGNTWTEPMITDVPDCDARVRAGNLPDGRCYLIGNAYPDRSHLLLLLSDDGLEFDRAYMVADYPTAARVYGFAKSPGHQYPGSLVDGDWLFIGYSVNKEDIECAMVRWRILV
ncbi:MAG: sialidase family protein [Bryobacteraceae bacterium]